MSALDSASLLIEHGNIWVGSSDSDDVDLGAVRNVRFTGQQVRTRVESDNRGTIINKVRLMGRIEFDWLEAGNAEKMEVLFKGIITRTTNAGSAVSGATQALVSPFVANNFYEIEGQNNDGTKPTINSLTGATDGALTEDDDFHIVQNAAGKWGIVMNTVSGGTNLSTLSQVCTLNYDYTPAASQVLTGGTNQTATNRWAKIVGPSEDDSSLERILILSECTAVSDMVFPFVEVENANDVGVMPVVLEGNKGTTWTLTDEVNPS